jgi:hypothetical protein
MWKNNQDNPFMAKVDRVFVTMTRRLLSLWLE